MVMIASLRPSARLKGALPALVLGLAAAAAAVPAAARDHGLGLKGTYRGHHAKPVPAPAPIPEYEPRYYIGLSVGYVAASSGSSRSYFLDADSPAIAGAPPPVRDFDEFSGLWSVGITAGRYFSHRLRGELEIAFRNEERIAGGVDVRNEDTFLETETDTRVRVSYHTFVGKLIYDLDRFRGFTPFVGAGFGGVVYNIQGQANTAVAGTEISAETSNDVAWGIALMVLGGVAIDLDHSKKLDIGYQGTWTSGDVSTVLTSIDGEQVRYTLEDRFDHEIRIGLRWDLH